ncbi:methyl-accepting chemotaxis protein [Marinoscillum sp.]|uniref:methyl-accepting chemotaxis protein n=1 Tax=Marinoscillum sp. TaxID=2024838 RepID=UPI003BACA0FA
MTKKTTKSNQRRLANLSIGRKISGSFLILILISSLSGIYTYFTLSESIGTLTNLLDGTNPALRKFDEFKELVKDSRTYTINWVYVKNYQDDKIRLEEIHRSRFDSLKADLQAIIASTSNGELDELKVIINDFEQVMQSQQEVMQYLSTAQDYEDPMVFFMSEDLVENTVIPGSDQIIDKLSVIIEQGKNYAAMQQNQMRSSFNTLSASVIVTGLIAIVFAIMISWGLSINITKPLRKVHYRILEMGRGVIPQPVQMRNRDELGEIGDGINSLIAGFKSSSEFAREIGNGNLNVAFEARGEEDVLGHSLISMRDNLTSALNEINEVVRLAGEEGQLDARYNLKSAEGAWTELGKRINNLLEAIAKPILQISGVMQSLAEGDLSRRLSEDLKGDYYTSVSSLNRAMDNVSLLIEQISVNAVSLEEHSSQMLSSSEEMKLSTTEIASAVAQMSSGAQNQVIKVDEASKFVESILTSTKEMGVKAETINEAAKSGVDRSVKGQSMVTNVVTSMGEISEYSSKTNNSIRVLTERSSEITRILSVITDIASQTNLLALNAAIEAAQAGEFGRGFAVVAEEIRKLAEDSRKSAQEIETLVLDVQNDTREAASIINQMSKSVHDGEQASNAANQVFGEIAESTRKTLQLSEEIVRATEDQELSVQNIAKNTESIVVIAEQTASGTEEAASSASELSNGMITFNDSLQQLADMAYSLKSGTGKFLLAKNN